MNCQLRSSGTALFPLTMTLKVVFATRGDGGGGDGVGTPFYESYGRV